MDSSLLASLFTSALLGGLVGLEREYQNKPAGLRTNLLISVGSALFMILSARIGATLGGDPTRIAAQIITGIGFIGAGAILYSKGSVLGLTTAATIWVVAGIGMAAGAGQYLMAYISTALVISTLLLLGQLEGRVGLKGRMRRYVLRVNDLRNLRKQIDEILQGGHVAPERITYRREAAGYSVSFAIKSHGKRSGALATRLLETEGVVEVDEEPE